MKPRLILTGSTGSIGRYFLLQAKKKYEVYECDLREEHRRSPEGEFDALILCHGGDQGADIFGGNVSYTKMVLSSMYYFLKKDAAMVVITSRRSVIPSMKEWEYSAAKAAQRAYIHAMYKHYPQMRITTIAPGWVESDMAKQNKAKSVISLEDLWSVVDTCLRVKTARIKEIALEPIGDTEL